jgi:hypothetical protein
MPWKEDDAMRHTLYALLTLAALVGVVGPVAAEDPEQIVLTAHYGFSGVITKIQSDMLFVSPEAGLMPRVVSPNQADRLGLHDARVGEMVNVLVDSGNVLIDVSKTDRFFPDHHYVVGRFHYADPFWSEIQLSTPEGPASFQVDPLAGSKLPTLQEGTPITVELDADNVMIDVHRAR